MNGEEPSEAWRLPGRLAGVYSTPAVVFVRVTLAFWWLAQEANQTRLPVRAKEATPSGRGHWQPGPQRRLLPTQSGNEAQRYPSHE